MNTKLITGLVFTVVVIGLFLAVTPGAPPVPATQKNTLPEAKLNGTKEEALQYEARVESIEANPTALDTIPLWDLHMIANNISGIELKDKLSADEWLKLKRDETKLFGVIVHSLESRIDPSVSTTRLEQISYTPYDMAHSAPWDYINVPYRIAYNNWVRHEEEMSAKENEQIELKHTLDFCQLVGKDYLKLLYPDQPQKDPDEFALLHDAGLDQPTIKQLTGPSP